MTMSNESQVQTLKEVLELEKHLVSAEKNLTRKKKEHFSAPPTAPVCRTVQRTYPSILEPVKFSVPIFIIGMIFSFIPGFIYLGYYFKKKKEYDEKAQMPENYVSTDDPRYIAKCAELDAQYDEKDLALKQEYTAEKDKYDTETLPNYQKDLDAWNAQHEQELQALQDDLSNSRTRLASIYADTKIVPMQYRNIDALEYIYNMISTSDYDVTYAINSYDTHRQRMLDTERMKIEEARLQEQQIANDLADEHAQLLSEQNAISEQARRDAKFASAVGMVQQHNSNKYLKNISNRR